MLSRLLTLTLALLFSTTTILSAPLPKAEYYPWRPVTFHSAHSAIPPDSTVELAWEGGSGNGYEVYYIPQWADQAEYYPVDIATTFGRSVTWHTPKADAFPVGTTFIVGIKDVSVGHGSDWYDLTGLIRFGEK